MDSNWPLRIVGLMVMALLCAGAPWFFSHLNGESEFPEDWAVQVRRGEELLLIDTSSRTRFSAQDDALYIRALPGGTGAVLVVVVGICMAGLGVFLVVSARDSRGEAAFFLFLGGGLLNVLLGGGLVGLTTSHTEHTLSPGQLTTERVYLGWTWSQHTHPVVGPVDVAIREECHDTDDVEVCMGWAFVEVPTADERVVIARVPHSLGSRPQYDVGQEAVAAGLAEGIQRFVAAR